MIKSNIKIYNLKILSGGKMKLTRRSFLHQLGCTGTAIATTPLLLSARSKETNSNISSLSRSSGVSPNDNIQFALIGAGGMGKANTRTALKIEGVKLVAACDLYDGRLKQVKEEWGDDIFTTRDYREILERKDIDAVIVATPDHWHQQISIDAMKKGKAVYCEKPMVHSLNEGHDLIKAQKKTKQVFVVGSQGLSSLGNEKARELLAQGAIGKLNYAEGFWARHSPVGAWQYPIPEDASEQTVDWDTFLKGNKKVPFDAKRFFRWRNYLDYGTGMSGDLFVHLFSSLHFITKSYGPNKVYASGGLRYWKDGRDVPDVLIGVFDYPETEQHPDFNLSLRCNFVDGTSGTTYLKLVGSEGSMDVRWDDVILKRNKSEEMDDFAKEKSKNTKGQRTRKKMLPPEKVIYKAEPGYKGAHYDHFYNFFNAIRNNTQVVEDAVFGYRAAAPALACNNSYFNNEIVHWDPIKMKRVK